MNTRDLVLSMLKEIYAGNEFSHILLRQVLEKYDYLESNEKAFIKRLTEGTLERTIELDYVINQFSKTPVNKMKPLIRALMRMSVYQILYMDSVPDSAVCNEAVKLAALHKFTSLKGFVNGVLRNIVRNKEQISYPDKQKEFKKYLSVICSLPEWMVEHFIREYGREKAEKICMGLLQEKPVTVRVKESLTVEEKQQLLDCWKQQGIKIQQHPYLSYAYVLEKTEGVRNMAGFEEGMFMVQDVSSMLVAHVAGVKPEMQILDVCAAPGGKATHAAEKLEGSGQVIARDLTEYKVGLIQENIFRSGLTNIEAVQWDATVLHEESKEKADIVIADLPCSGLGVLGKKTDLKYKITEAMQSDLVKLQRKMLAVVNSYVKPGGKLLYSTCTIHKEENEENTAWFLKNHPEFKLVKEKQMLPGVDGGDGFYIAMFVKENHE